MIVGALVLILFLLGAGVCIVYGVGMAFSAVYLPVLWMLSNTAPIDMPGMPDITPPMSVIAGMVLGLVLKGGESLVFRWTLMDTIIVALSSSATISGWMNGSFYAGVHIIGEQALEFAMPYFAARVAFHSPAARRAALTSTIACAAVIAFFAPIEMRLWPLYYNRLLDKLSPRLVPLFKGLIRWGFFRSAVSFLHPIDFGNGCLIMLGMISTLAASTTAGLRNVYVQGGLAAAGIGLIASLSFGPYIGAMFTFCVVLTLIYIRPARRWLVPVVLLAIAGMVVMTFVLLRVDSSVNPSMPPFERSFRIRAVIVQRSWEFMQSAGFWGWGPKINQATLNLKSVDNSYMMFAMTRGWVFTGLWIAIPVVVAMRVQRALKQARNITEVIALSASAATVLGINVAMFTVWAGSIYARVWLVLLAFTMSLTEWFLAPVILPQQRRAPHYIARPAPRMPAPAGR